LPARLHAQQYGKYVQRDLPKRITKETYVHYIKRDQQKKPADNHAHLATFQHASARCDSGDMPKKIFERDLYTPKETYKRDQRVLEETYKRDPKKNQHTSK